MTETLERYHWCTYGLLDGSLPANGTQNSYHEYVMLKARVEVLRRYHRNLLGEDLVNLNTKELEQLERQLETSLKHIRSTQTQYMLDQLADLQRKEQMLAEDNNVLRRKLDASAADVHLRLSQESGEQSIPYNRPPLRIDIESSFEMGSNPGGSNNMNASAAPTHNVNGFVPGLML